MFFAFFFKKVIFADIRTWLLSSGCGEIKRMVYWDMMQDKGKIGKYHFVTHFPPLWTDALFFSLFFFWWISSWWTVEHVMWRAFFLFVKPPLPWAKLKTKHLLKKNAFWKKRKQTKNVLHVLLPLMFCVTGPLYQSVHCLKKKEEKDVSPMLTHKLLRWLICMNIEHVQVLYHYWFEDWLNIKSDYEDNVA